MSETNEGRFSDGAELTRTDSKGRVLVVRQLNLREEMDLLSVAGPDDAMNRRWMMYATMVACVRSIDGAPIPMAAKRTALLNNIDRIGAEGVAVVASILAAETPDDADEAEPGDKPSETVAVAKN